MLDFLKDIKLPDRIALFIFILFITLPPLWFIFYFERDYFKAEQTLKLILLSAAIGGPIALIHYFVGNIGGPLIRNEDGSSASEYVILTLAAGIASIPYYIPSLLDIFLNVERNLAVYIFLGIEFIVVQTQLYSGIEMIKAEKRRKKTANTEEP